MRLLLKLKPNFELKFKEFNTYWIQGLIYELILNSPFDRHNDNKFKWFNYYLFPKTDFRMNKRKYLIISSPSKDFIGCLKEKFEKLDKIDLGKHFEAEIVEIKIFKPTVSYNWWKVETPIILDIGKRVNKKHLYWTPKLKDENLNDFSVFLERLNENCLNKVKYYFDLSDYEIEGLIYKSPLFFQTYKYIGSEKIFFEKEGLKIRMAGTYWFLKPTETLPKKYLKFLFDTGLGEKNSLGFGFVNVIRNVD